MSQEVTFTAARSGTSWIGEVIDLTTHERIARTTTTYASEETAKSAAASMWRAMRGARYQVLLVTATGERAQHTFDAPSLAGAAREALKDTYRKPWGATVLRDASTGERYPLADCEALVQQAAA